MRILCFIVLMQFHHDALAQAKLPSTTVADIATGKKMAFSSLCPRGQVTLITFWATWCAPGKHEVKTISQHLGDWRKQVQFNYLTIAVDQQKKEHLVPEYVKTHKWQFPCYMDAYSALKPHFGINTLPYTLIIDKRGAIAYSHTGYVAGNLILAELKKAGKTELP